MNIQKLHSLFISCTSVSTDTRKIAQNSMFFALKGERFNANTFTQQALELGAKYVVIDEETYFIDDRTILVTDVLTTLQELAKYHRNFLNIPIIALTGSNGKTTTKELINAVLTTQYNVKATIGNLNNHIGVPLTMLSFDTDTEIGIVEMGANHQKEIEFLCEITQPDYGYITNFGKAHLEGFGGIEGVIKGKSELYTYLRNNHKKALINIDDAIQVEKSNAIVVSSFSLKGNPADYQFSNIEAEPLAKVSFNSNEIKSNLIGIYNAINICAAVSFGQVFSITDENCKAAIENYFPTNNRSQIIQKNSNEIILDAYNANPSSMLLALENFVKLATSKKKTLIIGDMFELGEESLQEHQNIVSYLESNAQTIQCYLVGNYFYQCKNETFSFYETFDNLKEYLASNPIHDSYLLVKGSRGMALERLLDLF